ncbi:MAG TPA: response regulator transcription factor [Blastocatellia bacterium]|nr:response regulator transcription factor [Blastocatellia bacterium]HMV84205.1 response regulator transcription factor [Blastocatellia bacterium]HMX28091.1 response regulator transcription factor [Blastocatellia bacterium]HMY75662.1 response regulator transcription factor [Blastocatellia bacterium]HMZ22145.1 response regulator transcription factor [Blastocatellia bacterium]
MTILIVEDSKALRRLLKSLLADLAEAIHECDDGLQAQSLCAAHRPDWVLMDLEIKTVDGLTATREIHRRFPDARIVMVTQYNSPALRVEAELAGAMAYVTKDNLFKLRGLLLGDCRQRPSGARHQADEQDDLSHATIH